MLYDIDEFIDKLKGKDYFETISLAEKECARVERISYNIKGAINARQNGSTDYIRQLKGLLFFLRYGKQPTGIQNYEFFKFKRLAEDLISNSYLDRKVLDLFK